MLRNVGRKIASHKRDNTGDAWMGETLGEGFAANHSARANYEDFHGDKKRGLVIAGMIAGKVDNSAVW